VPRRWAEGASASTACPEYGWRGHSVGKLQRDPQQWHSRLWQDVMRRLSTRQFGPVVRRFADAYGIAKSVVSEQFFEPCPAEVAGADRTTAGKPEVVCRDDRWHRV